MQSSSQRTAGTSFFRRWLNWWGKGPREYRKPPRRRFQPNLEALEDRMVPAQYLWTNGTSDGLWSTADNWTDLLGGPSAVPGEADYTSFGSGLGSNTDCTMDLPNATVFNLNMDSNYTATLTMPDGNTLSIIQHFVQNGTLKMIENARINAGMYFNINGAVVTDVNPSGTGVLYTGGSFFLNGSINVKGGGNPDLHIFAGGFDDGGTINIGVPFALTGNLTITSLAFVQLPFSNINIFAPGAPFRSVLDFRGGLFSFPEIQGAINVIGGCDIITDGVLNLSGGKLNIPSGLDTINIWGDVGLANGGEINMSTTTLLNMINGSLTVGSLTPHLSPTGGTVNLGIGATIFFPPAATTSTLVVMPLGVINSTDGAIVMNTSRVAALEIRQGELLLPPGQLNIFGSFGFTFIGGNLNNDGTLTFNGVSNTLRITGNYTQGGSGTLAMNLNNGGTGFSDLLLVGGVVTLNGKLKIMALSPLSPGQSWAIIISSFLITTNFATFDFPPDGNPLWTGFPFATTYIVAN